LIGVLRVVRGFSKIPQLPPGRNSFEVLTVKKKTDSQRHYDYLRVELGSAKTLDRFPLTDEMLFKLAQFLDAVGARMKTSAPTRKLLSVGPGNLRRRRRMARLTTDT
jgi:hypothetical protein